MTRAYPVQVMTWHEIVNDTVGEVPVAVTYCPLCNSGVAFCRQVGDRLLDFGTSGMLYADNLVMYDRQTESLWPQLTGQASVGVLTGTRLESLPVGVAGWDQFRRAHPDALVLSRDTRGAIASRTHLASPATAPVRAGGPVARQTECYVWIFITDGHVKGVGGNHRPAA